jgi:hypothetical protein
VFAILQGLREILSCQARGKRGTRFIALLDVFLLRRAAKVDGTIFSAVGDIGCSFKAKPTSEVKCKLLKLTAYCIKSIYKLAILE